MSSVKSEVFVKSTAALEKEVAEFDLKAEQGNIKDILDDFTKTCEPRRVQSSDSQDNGENQEEV